MFIEAQPPNVPVETADGVMRRLYARFARLIHEVGKFGIVGGICYGIDFAIFNLLLIATDEPFSSKTISTVIATTAAFVGNRYWTWRDRDRTSLRREYGLYFFFNVVGLGITLACIGLNAWLAGFWPGIFDTKIAINFAANVAGVGLASLFRFWAYRRYVFKPASAEV